MNPFYNLVNMSNQRMLSRSYNYCNNIGQNNLYCVFNIKSIPEPEPCVEPNYDTISGTVLVVGGCGYVGSNAIEFLYSRCPNLNFVNIDNLSGLGSNTNNISATIRNDANRYQFINCSMQDNTTITNILSNTYFGGNKIDLILLLAAYLPWQPSLNLDGFIQNNVTNIRSFLDTCQPFCVSNQIKQVIYQSTMMAYICDQNSVSTIPYTSFDYVNTDYSVTKSWATNLMLNYSKTIPITTIFPAHVFGGINQHKQDIFYLVQDTLSAGHNIRLQNKYKTHKDAWVHIYDLCKWYAILLLDGPKQQQVRLVNPTQIFTLYDTVSKIIIKLTGTNNPDDYIDFVDGEVVLPLNMDYNVNPDMNKCYIPKLTLNSEIENLPLP
jgi:nucleoside-diphosphate-sugar epimerase